MGQLEKYGLYVLCLLIFLILGVTVMGSGAVAAPKKGAPAGDGEAAAAAPQLHVGDPRDAGGGVAAKLPDFRKLLTPTDAPKPIALGERAADAVTRDATATPGRSVETPAAPPAGEVAEATAAVARPTYEIERGDNYESIARRRFGTRSLWPEIQRLNPKIDPKKLRPGMAILLPTDREVEAFLGKHTANRPAAKRGDTYTIAKGDTLIGIAKRELGSEGRLADIQALNPGLDPVNLRIGATIHLPAK